MNLDRDIYLVISDRNSGPIIYEIDLCKMDRATVAADISHGQYGAVLHVIELNPAQHICRDATHDFRDAIERDPDLA